MENPLSESQKRSLTAIFERGAKNASRALTQWLGEPVQLSVSTVDEVSLEDATGLLGPAESLVASCSLGLSGRLAGQLLLVFEDRAGLALADLLLRQPLGTADKWDELERSAACETANIVGCAYLNALSGRWPSSGASRSDASDSEPESESIVPSPPTFRHEFAGSLLEFALMDQAMESDRLLVIRSQFATDLMELRWLLVLVPSGGSLRQFALTLSDDAIPS